MERILEPEIMDSAEGAIAYAKADFSDSNQNYVARLIAEFPQHLSNVIDIGCGPADIPIRLVRARPGIHVMAVDGSKEMLRLAEQAVQAGRLARDIELRHGRIPDSSLPEHHFDAVLSKDMLHHLPDPAVLWNEARRLARPGGVVCVMDLIRPNSTNEAREIVESAAPDEDPILKEDFYNSLCAAFTVQEVYEQLRLAGLRLEVERITSRHMLVKGFLA